MKREEDTDSTHLHELGIPPSCESVKFLSRFPSVFIGVHPWLKLWVWPPERRAMENWLGNAAGALNVSRHAINEVHRQPS